MARSSLLVGTSDGTLLDHSGEVAAAVLTGSGALELIAAVVDPSAEMDLTAFNAPFQPARADYDWLSRDAAEVRPASSSRASVSRAAARSRS